MSIFEPCSLHAKCNLCDEVFPIDKEFRFRVAPHINWHKHHIINGRKYINNIKGNCTFEYY